MFIAKVVNDKSPDKKEELNRMFALSTISSIFQIIDQKFTNNTKIDFDKSEYLIDELKQNVGEIINNTQNSIVTYFITTGLCTYNNIEEAINLSEVMKNLSSLNIQHDKKIMIMTEIADILERMAPDSLKALNTINRFMNFVYNEPEDENEKVHREIISVQILTNFNAMLKVADAISSADNVMEDNLGDFFLSLAKITKNSDVVIATANIIIENADNMIEIVNGLTKVSRYVKEKKNSNEILKYIDLLKIKRTPENDSRTFIMQSFYN
jgi:hypothetical protein